MPLDDRIVQAIVIADSFNERFSPLTFAQPRCLLPLVNVPILEYTLEFLAVSGIQEVILFCRSHAEQIRAYVHRSRWSRPTSALSVHVVMSAECCSVGDALRDIDAKGLITTPDFLLVSGDLVSNLNISAQLRAHQERRKKDKAVIMSMILTECGPQHRTREHGEGAVFVLSKDGECLAYHPVADNQKFEIPKEALKKKQLSIRYDLLDCQVDICSQSVLALFTENFDYMDIRRDFCRGLLTSDLLGQRIYTDVISTGYAARVRSPRLYDAITRDLIARWAFPIVPEADLMGEEQPILKVSKGLIYTGEGVLLSRTSVINSNSVLAKGVSVGENSLITASVLGKGVQIGANCVITGSYMWDDVIIGSNCIITGAVIGNGARILTGCTVPQGCLLSAGVTVGPRVAVKPRSKVCKVEERLTLESLSFSGDEPIDMFTKKGSQDFGAESDAISWPDLDDFESDNGLTDEQLSINPHRPCPNTLCTLPLSDTDSESDADNTAQPILSHDDMFSEEPSAEQKQFELEAFEMARASIQSEHTVDNAALELNSLKFACNASFADCRWAVVRAITTTCGTDIHAIQKGWERWSALLQRFVFNESDQLEAIDIVKRAVDAKAFPYIIPVLYKTDLLDGDVVSEWQGDRGVDSLSEFVAWLEQSDDDSCDSDE